MDLGSRDSATVGGMVATNAGGTHVLRYGDTRAQVIGVEAVLGTGAVISHLGGLVKDNTGYDLPGLLCGSEGTLAVVTAARLRLVPPRCRFGRSPCWRSSPSPRRCVPRPRSGGRFPPWKPASSSFRRDSSWCARSPGCRRRSRDSYPVYLLVEAADLTDPTDALAEATRSVDDVLDVVVATDPSRRADLWRYREGHTEAINTLGPPHKLDVTLPLGPLAEFIDRVPGTVGRSPRAPAPGCSGMPGTATST